MPPKYVIAFALATGSLFVDAYLWMAPTSVVLPARVESVQIPPTAMQVTTRPV